MDGNFNMIVRASLFSLALLIVATPQSHATQELRLVRTHINKSKNTIMLDDDIKQGIKRFVYKNALGEPKFIVEREIVFNRESQRVMK